MHQGYWNKNYIQFGGLEEMNAPLKIDELPNPFNYGNPGHGPLVAAVDIYTDASRQRVVLSDLDPEVDMLVAAKGHPIDRDFELSLGLNPYSEYVLPVPGFERDDAEPESAPEAPESPDTAADEASKGEAKPKDPEAKKPRRGGNKK